MNPPLRKEKRNAADSPTATSAHTFFHPPPGSELERQANIRRNQELLQELGLPGQRDRDGGRRSGGGHGHDASSGGSSARQRSSRNLPPNKKERVQPERVQPRRTSNRIAGLEADSETLKRRYEVGTLGCRAHSVLFIVLLTCLRIPCPHPQEEAEASRAKYEAEKRARHEEHDLAFLLNGGNATSSNEDSEAAEDKASMERLAASLRDISAKPPTLASELLEDIKEKKRATANGDGDDAKHAELKDALDRMVLRSADKAVQRRVYSMVMHPSIDRDLIFIGDKEGSIGVWDPLASTGEGNDATEVGFGQSWSLQAHGKSPITCLRFDPVSADGLYSSSYDSTIRMQNLQSGTSTEVWAGQDDVLLSIFDILSPQTHPSAFTRTPDAGLDERSLWVADHRGGLCHYDLRQSGRRRTQQQTSRWQVCEKKVSLSGERRRQVQYSKRRTFRIFSARLWQIGGMAINPSMSSCISVASLDQHIRLFDVRALQTLPTTNDAPYNARNVDADVLSRAETEAQIANHKARLACTSVDWDPHGSKLVGVSYDDMVKSGCRMG